jgi:hypothetical protein
MTSLLFDDAEFLSPCADEISVITGISMGRFLPRVLSEAYKGTFLPESDMKSELDQ